MIEIMRQRYRIYRRQGGIFYLFDRQSKTRESLQTFDRSVAQRLLHAPNEAQQQPISHNRLNEYWRQHSDWARNWSRWERR